mmetsp:Transcript_1089/g.1817  ORF Transcript_1089/g.1817 Transcript_1089/m.1817 type:complete len:123 (+) Transcript_1089:892-1260(+)
MGNTQKKFRVRIQSHIAVYVTILGTSTAAAFAFVNAFGKTDEEKHEMLASKYANKVIKGDNQKQLQQFFNDLQDKSKKDQIDGQLNEILRGGKNERKRLHNPVSSVGSGTSDISSSSSEKSS